ATQTGTLTELPNGSAAVTREGVERPIGGTISPVRDHNGKITGAVVVFGSTREERAVAALPAIEESRDSRFEMVAESDEMQRLANFVRRVAASEVSAILLTGESGAGKDIIAKLLHHGSRREAQPFLAINCAAIPDTLL